MTEQGHCPGSNSHTEQCTDLKDCSHHLVFMRRVGRPGATVAWVLINSCWAPGPQVQVCHSLDVFCYPGQSTALLTQCFRSTSSSASHLRVKKGCFLLIISPSKKVVRVGYSYSKSKYPSKTLNVDFWLFLFVVCGDLNPGVPTLPLSYTPRP